MVAISPTQSNVQAALKSFLVAVLPPGTRVVSGQNNRVPEPMDSDYVVMTTTLIERIETNIDDYDDAKFTGSIAGTTLTISDVDPKFTGQIAIGSTIFGTGVAANTIVTALGTGTGGIGTYTVNNSQAVSSETLSAGTQSIEQPAKFTVQLDFHSADISDAGDMAQTVSTLFRDTFGTDQFAAQDPNYGVVPLYADDPKQTPFLNDQQQYEWRWVVEALLQANQVLSIPQQFADSVEITPVSVVAAYPS
jgi:hypothetical protein